MIALVASVIIAAVIILAVALVQWRGQHTSIDATQFATAKNGVLEFADIVEQDVSNLGAGLSVADMKANAASNQGGFTASSVAFDTLGSPRTVEFYSWADTTADFANPLATGSYTVRYEWAATGNTVLVLHPPTNTYVSVPTYQIDRYVDGTKVSESIDTVTQFRFDLFDASGASTAALSDVRQVEVTLAAVSPTGGGQAGMIDPDASAVPAVSESRWNKVFRPANLGRKTG